ncbi:hypothetical protein BH24ACI3_BH24ACI3_05850 [soil metagenome]
MKKLLIPSIVALSFGIGCGKAVDVGTSNSANTANAIVTTDANALPPGFSPKPLEPSANSTPGIPPPGQARITEKGATPTPGIPEPGTGDKRLKPGTTPTPGIPSEEEIRRQMRQPVGNVNAPPSNATTAPNERKKPRPVGNNN